VQVLIVYYTKTGHTLEAANATAAGIRAAGSEADLVRTVEFDASRLASYDALIVGSPCWAGAVTAPGIAAAVKEAVDALPAGAVEGKRCGAISVCSAMGAETTIRGIGEALAGKGCTDFRAGPWAKAGVPLSLWVGPAVRSEDEERFRAYGSTFVA
jgi:flavorubredoxin